MGAKRSRLEAVLEFHLRALGVREWVREYRFQPPRRWRFDLAWPDLMLAVEVEGGIWSQTRTGRGRGHAHPARFVADCQKYNAAAMAGWTVLRYPPDLIGTMLEGGEAALEIQAAIQVLEDREETHGQ